MTYLQTLQPANPSIVTRVVGPLLVVGCFLVAYFPTFKSLLDGPWRTEQEGHGPLIIAASLWLVWQSREKVRASSSSPAPLIGWLVLIGGPAWMYLTRIQQGLVTFEMLSLLPVIVGCILIVTGWPALKPLAFPLGFLLFAVP